jgi:hypothetical protein
MQVEGISTYVSVYIIRYSKQLATKVEVKVLLRFVSAEGTYVVRGVNK